MYYIAGIDFSCGERPRVFVASDRMTINPMRIREVAQKLYTIFGGSSKVLESPLQLPKDVL